MKAVKLLLIGLMASTLFLAGCDEEEFEHASVTFGPTVVYEVTEGASRGVDIQILFSRPLLENGTVTIEATSETAILNTHFEADAPSFGQSQFTLSIPAGSVADTFTVKALNDNAFTEGHVITLSIKETTGGVKSSPDKSITVKVKDSDTPTVRASFDFNSCDNGLPQGFSVVNTPDSKQDKFWDCVPFGMPDESGSDTRGVQVNGYRGDDGMTDSWLLLNTSELSNVNLENYSIVYVGFWTESYYGGSGTIELKYSTDYAGGGDNPLNATWINIPIADQLPPKGSGVENGGFWQRVFVNASVLAGKSNVHLAVHYSGASSSNASSWTVDEMEISGD